MDKIYIFLKSVKKIVGFIIKNSKRSFREENHDLQSLIERTGDAKLHFWRLYLAGTKVLPGDWTLQRRLSCICEEGESQVDDGHLKNNCLKRRA